MFNRLMTLVFLLLIATGCGGGAGGDGDSLSIMPPPKDPPYPPTGLVGMALSHTEIELNWRDTSVDELGFMIERSDNAIDFVQIGKVPFDTTVYKDTGLSEYTTYFYRVKTFNCLGDSLPCGIAEARTLAVPWSRTYGNALCDMGQSVLQTQTGGFIVLGSTQCHGAWCETRILQLDGRGEIDWERAYRMDEFFRGCSLHQTVDGGIMVIGTMEKTQHNGHIEYATEEKAIICFKLDSKGDVEWSKIIEGGVLEAYTSCVSENGDFLVAGSIETSSGDEDILLLQLNSKGKIRQQIKFGGGRKDSAFAIVDFGADEDYRIVIAGSTNSFDKPVPFRQMNPSLRNPESRDPGDSHKLGRICDAWIVSIKYKRTGQLISDDWKIDWERTYGGSGREEARSICIDDSGNFVVAGWIENMDTGRDMWAFKIDPVGELLWQKYYVRPNGYMPTSNSDRALSVVMASEGHLALLGTIGNDTGNSYDYWLLKLFQSGTPKWQRRVLAGAFDEDGSLTTAQDGGLLIVGTMAAGSFGKDLVILKTNCNGTIDFNHGSGVRMMDTDCLMLKSDVSCVDTNATMENTRLRARPVVVDVVGTKVIVSQLAP